jgi:hypothetical protein
MRAGNYIIRYRDNLLGIVYLSALMLLPIYIYTRLTHSYSAATRDQISLRALKEEGTAQIVSRITGSLSATLNSVL